MKDTPNTASFIGYEYKSLTVNRRMESVYADGYQISAGSWRTFLLP